MKLSPKKIAIVALFFLTACKALISQNPADTFWAKKFPRQLELIRAQMREIPVKEQEKILERIEKDALRQDLLRVAVIDSGVDVAHPDLRAQLEYRATDGHLAGAGIDIMGHGASGSHVYVDPTFFAFGAESIRDGKIVNPPESPLAVLKKTNDLFAQTLLEKIQNDPDLRSSFFANLNLENIGLLTFEQIRDNSGRTLESYKVLKAKGEFINPQNLETKSAEMKYEMIHGWSLNPTNHRIKALDSLGKFEHVDKFIQAVNESFEKINKDLSYDRNIKNLQTFLQAQKPEVKITQAEVFGVLQKNLSFVKWGIDTFDPINRFEAMFKGIEKYKGLSIGQSLELYAEELASDFKEKLKDPKTTKKEKQTLEAGLKQIQSLAHAGKLIDELKNDPDAYNKMRSNIRRHVYRTEHPYLSAEGNTNSHGTHVAGVIAKQDPNVRILPIRVTTSTITVAQDRKAEIVDRFLTDFEKWMESPLIQELKKVIAAEYGDVRASDNVIKRELRKYLEANTLNAVFIDEVLKAVEAAGQNKVKLANVSLGLTFKKDHSLDARLSSYVQDLFSEFTRYKVGQTIEEKAKGTLFVVATGNDGGWVDGVSKSAFPVGITSPRLLKLAKEKGLPEAPNNSTRNVLAVSSINKNGTLTPFTNILIDPRIPQIFSTGEEIMSLVPAKDISRVDKLLETKFRSLEMAKGLIATDQISDRVNRLKMGGEPTVEDQIADREKEYIMDVLKSLRILVQANEPIDRVRMSGTSMATPTVVGILAEYLIKKMRVEKISAADLYNHPAFSPEVIVKEMMAMAKLSPQSEVLTIKMLVDGIKTWNESKNERKFKQFMKETFATPKAAANKCRNVY
ncbi:MAG: S8 family serine peptidase [Pseudobdellovibrionaceae bacterium]